MNDETLRPVVLPPLPRGDEMEAWVVDAYDPKLVRKTYYRREDVPYHYTPAGQIVRMAMPPNGVVRARPFLRTLARLIEPLRGCGDLPAQFLGDDDWTDAMRA